MVNATELQEEKQPPIPVHPAANLFPVMSGQEFERFKADIQKNGQQKPVEIWRGQLLDGRNRVRACHELGIKLQVHTHVEDLDPIAYVLSANLHRRHLKASQRAAIAAEAEGLIAASAKERQIRKPNSVVAKLPQQKSGAENPASTGKARDEAAKLMEVSPRYVSDAKKLKADSPEVFEQVKAGELSLQEAKRAVVNELECQIAGKSNTATVDTTKAVILPLKKHKKVAKNRDAEERRPSGKQTLDPRAWEKITDLFGKLKRAVDDANRLNPAETFCRDAHKHLNEFHQAMTRWRKAVR